MIRSTRESTQHLKTGTNKGMGQETHTQTNRALTQKLSLNSMVHELCVKEKRVLISILNSLYYHGQLTNTIFFKMFDNKICPQIRI